MTDWIVLGLRILAPLILYLFIGITLYRIFVAPRKVSHPKTLLRQVDNSEQIYWLQTNTSFGRSKNNTIVVDDELVSAHHAVLNYKNSHWWLVDLDSTNGTRVNDRFVKKPTVLTYGDIISLGSLSFQLERDL